VLITQPVYRTVLAVDVENSTARNNRAKGLLRHFLYELVAEALALSGIGVGHHDPFIDRGDGLLILIYPCDQVPKTLLLGAFVPALSRLVARHNARHPEAPIRLRVVVHAGEVHYDPRAPFGETLDIAFRLLDAPAVKEALRWTTAPLVLVISGEIYRSVVRHRYPGIDPMGFRPMVHLWVADAWQVGWVHVPDGRWVPRPAVGRQLRIPPAAR
jgi:class 3 adenylate cyclase